MFFHKQKLLMTIIILLVVLMYSHINVNASISQSLSVNTRQSKDIKTEVIIPFFTNRPNLIDNQLWVDTERKKIFKGVEKEFTFSRGLTVMLIPLDNRPVNLYVPTLIGATGGVNILTPPCWMLGDHEQEGLSPLINKWMIENGDKVDAFIISSDMVAYGGLVASRKVGSVSQEEAINRLGVITNLKELFPEKPLFVFDTIQRLASTATSKETLDDYQNIKLWGTLVDKVLRTKDPSLEEELKEVEERLPREILVNYQKARERNHSITLRLLELVYSGIVDYLLIGQDDAGEFGIHNYEQGLLQRKVEELNVNERVMFLPGADELDILLLTRFYHQHYNISPSFYISYTTEDGGEWISDYENIPLQENLEKHLASINAVSTTEENATFHLLVHTHRAVEPEEGFDVREIASLIRRSLASKQEVILADVANYKGDPDVFHLLKEEDLLSSLSSYTGWNTPANTIGLAISHGSIQKAFIDDVSSTYSEGERKAAVSANYEYQLHRLLKDHYYKNGIVNDLRKYMKENEIDQWNMGESEGSTLLYVQHELQREVNGLLRTLRWKSEDGEESYQLKEVPSIQLFFPWNRLFEIEIRPHVVVD